MTYAEQRVITKCNRCWTAQGPWKLNNEEETRNYFESIRDRDDTESTQEITDVRKLHQVIRNLKKFKIIKSNTQVFIWAD